MPSVSGCFLPPALTRPSCARHSLPVATPGGGWGAVSQQDEPPGGRAGCPCWAHPVCVWGGAVFPGDGLLGPDRQRPSPGAARPRRWNAWAGLGVALGLPVGAGRGDGCLASWASWAGGGAVSGSLQRVGHWLVRGVEVRGPRACGQHPSPEHPPSRRLLGSAGPGRRPASLAAPAPPAPPGLFSGGRREKASRTVGGGGHHRPALCPPGSGSAPRTAC